MLIQFKMEGLLISLKDGVARSTTLEISPLMTMGPMKPTYPNQEESLVTEKNGPLVTVTFPVTDLVGPLVTVCWILLKHSRFWQI